MQRTHSLSSGVSTLGSSTGRQTPTSSEDGTVGPSADDMDRQSTTSTSLFIFGALNINDNEQEPTTNSRREFSLGPESASLTPNRSLTTYGDLYNATPTPTPNERAITLHQRPRSEESSPCPSNESTATAALCRLTLATSGTLEGDEGDEGLLEDTSEQSQPDDGEPSDEEDYLYNIRQEGLPRAPIYDRDLQSALRQVRGQLSELGNEMRQSDLVHDPSTILHGIYKDILEASTFEYPATRIVGFIGESGVGKSSLINSLLDQNDIARSSGDGAACTTVVTEFRHVNETHPNRYTIEADFMDTEEVKELLEELLRSFRQFYTGAYTEVSTPDEQERVRAVATRAQHTLTSLFPNHPEIDHDFLLREEANAEVDILETLQNCAMDNLDYRPGGRDALHHVVVAQDSEDCMVELDKLTTDPTDVTRPAIWPFVKLIRWKTPSESQEPNANNEQSLSTITRPENRLGAGGSTRDLNYARVRATERYLRHHCDEVVVVSNIIRCTTDPSIDDIINRCASNQPIRIACTRSEDVNATETARATGGEVARHIREIQQGIATIDRQIRVIRSRRRTALEAQRQRLEADETQFRDQREQLGLQLTRYLMTRRNQEVTQLLSDRWRERGRHGVRVFCVSNRLYADHREDDREQADEYLRLSGIPELRRYCQLVPADAQLRATESFLHNQVAAVLGSLTQWALSAADDVTAERARILRGVLTEAERTLKMHLTSQQSAFNPMQARFKAQFKDSIVRRIRNRRHDWSGRAVEASEEWRTPNRCWNQEILQSGQDVLTGQWDNLSTHWEEQQEDLEERISNVIETVCDSIEEHVDLAPEVLENLVDNLRARQRCIMDTISDAMDNLIDETEHIRNDAMHGHASSYIAGVMRPAYNTCNTFYGTGSDIKRKQAMREHLSSTRFLTEYAAKIGTNHSQMMERVFQNLVQKVQEEVANITRDLRASVNAEGERTEAGRNPAFARGLRKNIGRVQDTVARARRALRQAGQGQEGV
ncbi:hypothetical protein FE257_010847 [Aspergillus nanangensis]|uniref:DUF7605 domain-containing protein n=1 Tax=Aspergillus nanangensis TaxID=2582783 RepID=A0AAD4CVL4_ASPNN|nr:hypothetical protein FE257_010847 [Aspergillus nanangensis]